MSLVPSGIACFDGICQSFRHAFSMCFEVALWVSLSDLIGPYGALVERYVEGCVLLDRRSEAAPKTQNSKPQSCEMQSSQASARHPHDPRSSARRLQIQSRRFRVNIGTVSVHQKGIYKGTARGATPKPTNLPLHRVRFSFFSYPSTFSQNPGRPKTLGGPEP